MSDKRNRPLGQRARPARNMVVALLTELREVLANDALYESALYQVEGWIVGQRAWLNAVTSQDVSHPDLVESGKVSLPMVEKKQ